MRFTNRQRLQRTADYSSVRVSGLGRECGPFLLQLKLYDDSERPATRRVGVIATRRYGNAVARNRAKRRLRELFRLHQDWFPANSDAVFVARNSLKRRSYEDCSQILQQSLKAMLRSTHSAS